MIVPSIAKRYIENKIKEEEPMIQSRRKIILENGKGHI